MRHVGLVIRRALRLNDFWDISFNINVCHRTLSAHCLKDLKIFVPEAVLMGNAATLSCQYDLEQVSDTSLEEKQRW